jgi:hypothetical protein
MPLLQLTLFQDHWQLPELLYSTIPLAPLLDSSTLEALHPVVDYYNFPASCIAFPSASKAPASVNRSIGYPSSASSSRTAVKYVFPGERCGSSDPAPKSKPDMLPELTYCASPLNSHVLSSTAPLLSSTYLTCSSPSRTCSPRSSFPLYSSTVSADFRISLHSRDSASPTHTSAGRVNTRKRSASQHDGVSPVGNQKKRRSLPHNAKLAAEESFLLHLKNDEGLTWREIAARFQRDKGISIQIPALQMRLTRLRSRARS